MFTALKIWVTFTHDYRQIIGHILFTDVYILLATVISNRWFILIKLSSVALTYRRGEDYHPCTLYLNCPKQDLTWNVPAYSFLAYRYCFYLKTEIFFKGYFKVNRDPRREGGKANSLLARSFNPAFTRAAPGALWQAVQAFTRPLRKF